MRLVAESKGTSSSRSWACSRSARQSSPASVGASQQRDLGGVADRVTVGGDVGVVAQHRGSPELARVDAVGEVDLDHPHLVGGERAGLVRGDHAGAAQGLDGGQAPHQRVLAGHAPHADGEGEGGDRRQTLGHDGHGERDRHLDDLVDLEPRTAQAGEAAPSPTTTSDSARPSRSRPGLERRLHGVGRGGEVGDAAHLGPVNPVATTTPRPRPARTVVPV
jgi:hypothetical protein